MNLRRTFIFGLGMAVFAGKTQAALELPSIIGDHMVLQSGTPAILWGKDQPGQKILISIAGQSATAQADTKGRWKVALPALPIGGPFELLVTGSSTIKVKDVLVGEVWLGSGQSNMEFHLDQAKDGAQSIAQSRDPQLRLFLQKSVMSAKPLDEPQGEWKVCGPESAGNFSAVAYYFGRNLRKTLKVPVGLIAASWGGSYAESWTPEGTLKSNPAFKPIWDRWNKVPRAERKGWLKGRFPVDFAVRNLRLIPKNPAQSPLTLAAQAVSLCPADGPKPGFWGMSVKEGSDLSVSVSLGSPRMTGSFLSDAWGFMTTALGPGGQPADLSAYEGVEFDSRGDGKYILFLSQSSITDWDNYRTPDSFEVSGQWNRHWIDFSSLKQSGWGKAQPFTPAALLRISFGVDPKPLIEIPSALYNGMIHPLTPFPIKGVIWYQGEANAIRPEEYGALLTAMIDGWRKAWAQPDMPFLLAQLPNYIPGPGQGQNQWSDLREQQRQVAEEPNNAMAVLIDLGDPHDIHPKDKAPVGFRLAQEALKLAYGLQHSEMSPLFDKAVMEGSKVRLSFEDAADGLESKGGVPRGFEIAGPNGRFEEAKARIEEGTVLIWSDSIAHPMSIRYAWGDNPLFSLYGKNDLPASPFTKSNLQP